jgi:hypothetical protein
MWWRPPRAVQWRDLASVAACLLLSSLGFLSGPVIAQSPAGSSAVPNLSGVWDRKGPIPGRPANVSPVQLARARAIGFSMFFDEVLHPGYDCSPVSIPVILNDNFSFQILQQPDRVIMKYEKQDVVRIVWLEGHGHPKPGVYDFTLHGHSTGRYENNQLVIETTKFLFDPLGLHDSFIPSSTQKKVTERYWREGNLLRLESVTEDRLVLTRPYTYQFEWQLSNKALVPYDCDPEGSSFDRQFYETNKYQDPDWMRLRGREYYGLGVN